MLKKVTLLTIKGTTSNSLHLSPSATLCNNSVSLIRTCAIYPEFNSTKHDGDVSVLS